MRESVERGLGRAACHRASAVAGVLTQWPEAHRRLSSVACTVVERTYHHQSARYTGHRAGSLLARPYTTTQDRLRHRRKHISKLFFPTRGDNVRSKSMRQCTIFANRIYSLCGPDTYRERSRSLHRDDKQHTHVVALISEGAIKCEYWIRNMCVTTERSRAG